MRPGTRQIERQIHLAEDELFGQIEEPVRAELDNYRGVGPVLISGGAGWCGS